MISLQFVLGSSFSSRAIAWFGQGTGGFSHVDAVLPSGELLGARNDAVGGKPPGIWIRPAFYEHWVSRCVVELPVAAPEAALWEKWLRLMVGSPYDQGAILGFIFGQKWHEPGHWICSALQTGALKHIGMLHTLPVNESQVTPDTLLMMVTGGLGGSFRVYD
ncbi:MAG: hypothetical protein KGL39_45865 [Patescibacteria group bacterium]|nr:hypothetical protein [Patescibacteria group bacterium]